MKSDGSWTRAILEDRESKAFYFKNSLYMFAEMLVMSKSFFYEQLPGSKIKTNIVSNYFWKWAKVMVAKVKGKRNKIGYIDFFCGPGTYEDGSDSTPVQIIKIALNNSDISQMLVSIFNDKDEA